MTDKLDLPRRYRDQLEALLREHVPDAEVWAYGSRVNGKSHEGSDLDLVLRSPTLESLGDGYLDLIEALEESDIPILIQAHDWARLPESFHWEIERDYVVVQEKLNTHTINADAWEEIAFDAVIDFREGPGILAKDFRENGIPLVRLAGLDRGVSMLEGCDYLDPEVVAARWSHFQLELGDVLLSTSASLGRIAVVGEEGVGAVPYTGIIRMRPKGDNLHSPFIRYLLEGPDFQRQTEMVGVGSVIRHFGPTHLRQMTVQVPPLPEQRAIAHILGTLDDKIEVNRRMNQTLEEMARAFFQDWFVDFGPVRAKLEGREPYLPPDLWALFPDRLVDSELGEIPEGWEVKALKDFGEIVTGKTPSTRNPTFYGTDVPFLKIPDMHERVYVVDTLTMLSHRGASSQKGKTLPSGSISVSCIATPGLVILNHRETQTNQQINSIVPSDRRTRLC